jgi:DNA (cytosine-5)-methyltransferase 1
MERPTFIDLFAGCGGLSLGLFQAGWQGQFAIEKSADAFSTLSHNLCGNDAKHSFDWPNWLPHNAMSTDCLLRNFRPELERIRGTVDLIAGGPPCQGFSSAGLRNADDPRNLLTSEYIRIVKLVQPRFLLLENVRGFDARFPGKKKSQSQIVEQKLRTLKPIGYEVFTSLIDASIFGVPQPRKRFVMIGVRQDLKKVSGNPFEGLMETAKHFRRDKGLGRRITTVKNAIGDLETNGKLLSPSEETSGFFQIAYKPPRRLSSYQSLMRSDVPRNHQPNSLRLTNHRGATIDRFQSILDECPKGKVVPKEFRELNNMKKQCTVPLDSSTLARTVTTLPDDLIHYSEPRILTVRENARLQSFPDWFDFQGKYTTGGPKRKTECPRYTQVGNAVPPLMAEAIGTELREIANEIKS